MLNTVIVVAPADAAMVKVLDWFTTVFAAVIVRVPFFPGVLAQATYEPSPMPSSKRQAAPKRSPSANRVLKNGGMGEV